MSEATEASEETGLLAAPALSLPFLQRSISQLNSLLLEERDQISSGEILPPAHLADQPPLATSFSLLALLVFRETKLRTKSSYPDAWDQWKRESATEEWLNTIDENIEQIWTSFLSAFRGSADLEIALWTEFRMNAKEPFLRVSDFVCSQPTLLNDRVVELCMKFRWERGAPLEPSRSRQYLAPRYDASCTPWIYHAFDLASQLAFLFLLAFYVLEPPKTLGPREIVLVIISISATLHSWTTSAPFILSILAFVVAHPSLPSPYLPSPKNLSFNLLLLSLVMHILQLHALVLPSPSLLFWPERCLPLAALISSSVFGTISKVVLFFLPFFFLSFYFLSYSMSHIYFWQSSLLSMTLPSPVVTREVALWLASVSFIIIFLSILMLSPSFALSPRTRSPWDRYSTSIGQEARTRFYSAVVRYSRPYPFPPPFNVVHFILIVFPAYSLRSLGVSRSFFRRFEKFLWRLLVGPFVSVANLLTYKPSQRRHGGT
ncbi:hypothetical protein D9757_006370 [Collybiopsis confluens]|uniref:Uncharacterized protein n=1 Tax=Collybiopsis confluens TaxID=2823264 RepID=A0A8H5HGS1_9AGAR|nr:hypothetical protein D9757_006370 [Collybiopsis confluens]